MHHKNHLRKNAASTQAKSAQKHPPSFTQLIDYQALTLHPPKIKSAQFYLSTHHLYAPSTAPLSTAIYSTPAPFYKTLAQNSPALTPPSDARHHSGIYIDLILQKKESRGGSYETREHRSGHHHIYHHLYTVIRHSQYHIPQLHHAQLRVGVSPQRSLHHLISFGFQHIHIIQRQPIHSYRLQKDSPVFPRPYFPPSAIVPSMHRIRKNDRQYRHTSIYSQPKSPRIKILQRPSCLIKSTLRKDNDIRFMLQHTPHQSHTLGPALLATPVHHYGYLLIQKSQHRHPRKLLFPQRPKILRQRCKQHHRVHIRNMISHYHIAPFSRLVAPHLHRHTYHPQPHPGPHAHYVIYSPAACYTIGSPQHHIKRKRHYQPYYKGDNDVCSIKRLQYVAQLLYGLGVELRYIRSTHILLTLPWYHSKEQYKCQTRENQYLLKLGPIFHSLFSHPKSQVHQHYTQYHAHCMLHSIKPDIRVLHHIATTQHTRTYHLSVIQNKAQQQLHIAPNHQKQCRHSIPFLEGALTHQSYQALYSHHCRQYQYQVSEYAVQIKYHNAVAFCTAKIGVIWLSNTTNPINLLFIHIVTTSRCAASVVAHAPYGVCYAMHIVLLAPIGTHYVCIVGDNMCAATAHPSAIPSVPPSACVGHAASLQICLQAQLLRRSAKPTLAHHKVSLVGYLPLVSALSLCKHSCGYQLGGVSLAALSSRLVYMQFVVGTHPDFQYTHPSKMAKHSIQLAIPLACPP